VVSEAALTVCLAELHRALGDAAPAPQLIEIVQRRGYRFIAPVRGETPLFDTADLQEARALLGE
jgi:DNA-binding winged helix-turn-helix (wHTH) protein